MAEGEGTRTSWTQLGCLGQVGVLLLALLAIAGSGGLVYLCWFTSLPSFKHPNFWESLLENRTMIGFVRFALISVAVYIVVSIVGLVSRGQWLASVGPFKAGEAVRAVVKDSEGLQEELESAKGTIESLRAQLSKHIDAMVVAVKDRDETFRENVALKRQATESPGNPT